MLEGECPRGHLLGVFRWDGECCCWGHATRPCCPSHGHEAPAPRTPHPRGRRWLGVLR